MSGLYYEEFEIGKVYVHALRRTVTEMDNMMFSNFTLNPQPLHIDRHFCETQTEWGEPLMNSIFTLGFVVGVSVADTTLGTTLGNLGFDKTTFPNPVFVGDTIYSATSIVDKRESRSKPDRGIVTFEHTGTNQRGEIVCSCVRTGMMMKRPA